MEISVLTNIVTDLYQKFFRSQRKFKKATKAFNSKHYSCENHKLGVQGRTVIFMVDGKMHHEGWSDRLRGILTTYCICKKLGIQFKLYFKHPFDLENFFKPNLYDWTIDASDISYHPEESEALIAFYVSRYDHIALMKYILKTIEKSDKKQIHIYSNIAYVFNWQYYSQAFNELFRLSDIVLTDLVHYKSLLAPKYISVTTRFQNLLGDFEELGIIPLEEGERKKLIDNCLEQIEYLHNEYPEYNVLATSDSYAFLCEADKKPYVRIIDGRVVHMDWNDNKDLNVHKKSFIDFLCISGADYVFLLQSGKMYMSGFPYSASLLGNRPYKMISF